MKLLLGVILTFAFNFAQGSEKSTDAAAVPGFVDAPAQCFAKKTYPCSLRAVAHFLAFERDSNQYHLGEKSAVLFLGPSEVQVMQGQVWIQKSEALKVKLSSALALQVGGEWFFEKSRDATTLVRNLDGEVQFLSKFVFENEVLPVGYQNWYGGISTSGDLTRGVIRPIALTDFLKAWIPLSGLSFAEIKKRTNVYRESWNHALNQSAEFYQQVITRRMASHIEKAQRLERNRRAVSDERAQLKKMYLEKNGL